MMQNIFSEDAKDLWQKLKDEKPPVVLYGMNNIAKKTAAKLAEIKVDISGVMVSNEFLREKRFLGFPLETLSQIEDRLQNFVILLCFGTDRPEVLARIREIARRHPLYAPDFPVTGDGFFDMAYYRRHRKDFEQLSERLADDQSRLVLEKTLSYKLSGKLSFLSECETSEESNWLPLLPADTYFDLGAYTGDTVGLFRGLNPNFRTIYAFEPEARNYRKLSEYAQCDARIRCFPMGISSREEQVPFAKGGGRGSGAKKTVLTPFTSLDRQEALFQNSGKTLIKMDLEGWEKKAIAGGETILQKYMPNLMVAAYHRTEDLLEIPSQVLSLCPEYTLRLRKSPCIPAWELNYLFTSKD